MRISEETANLVIEAERYETSADYAWRDGAADHARAYWARADELYQRAFMHLPLTGSLFDQKRRKNDA